ncbi:hypothetical protein [Novosphingobium sp. AAP93]|uniref:hypothetical protein n=1 Tax=Novosphingobium sp. AAP93 TaxID=1523427 RepID=UPI0006B89407|nr:hypothetical protein [Novosphingobium sp. AAP93]KPF82667.1 hypothetical protein IP83_11320 [Novosphingobium sp. AAP93]
MTRATIPKFLSGDRKSSTNYSYANVGGGRADFGGHYPNDFVETVNNETYNYSADGYLSSTSIGNTVRARFTRDAMGRVTDYREYSASGYVSTNPATNSVYQRTASYNSKGLGSGPIKLLAQTVIG